MTIAELRRAIDGLDGALEIEVVAPITDEDGDDCDAAFVPVVVEKALDADTAEYYARFACEAWS